MSRLRLLRIEFAVALTSMLREIAALAQQASSISRLYRGVLNQKNITMSRKANARRRWNVVETRRWNRSEPAKSQSDEIHCPVDARWLVATKKFDRKVWTNMLCKMSSLSLQQNPNHKIKACLTNCCITTSELKIVVSAMLDGNVQGLNRESSPGASLQNSISRFIIA